MNISGASVGNTPYAVSTQERTGKSDKKTDSQSDKKLDELEDKKKKLEQEMKDEKNPFALEQSKEYKELQKRIEALDQQIQMEKIKQDKKSEKKDETEQVNSPNAVNASKNNSSKLDSDQLANITADGDSYTPSLNKTLDPTKGIYKLSRDKNGQQALAVDCLE